MYCILGAGLVGSMIFCMFLSDKSKYNKKFMSLLDKDQLEKYKKIKNERMNIYLQGYFLGLVLGLLVALNSNVDRTKKLCMFLVVSLGVNYLFYSLYPKSDYMLNHLTTKCQNKAWLEQYKYMKTNHLLGLTFGMAGYILLGKYFC